MQYAKSDLFVVTCVGSKQSSKRDRFTNGMVDEELGVELCCGAYALGGLKLITSGDLDRHHKLRVEELVITVLKLYALWKLFQDLRVYNFLLAPDPAVAKPLSPCLPPCVGLYVTRVAGDLATSVDTVS